MSNRKYKDPRKLIGEPDLDGGQSLDHFHSRDQIARDVKFVIDLLPSHYTVQESNKTGSIHCKSDIGIRKPPYVNQSTGRTINDAEDDKKWFQILSSIKNHFGERFQEVFHNTCFCYVDFTIYLKTGQS